VVYRKEEKEGSREGLEVAQVSGGGHGVQDVEERGEVDVGEEYEGFFYVSCT
jgi:hypothetical protein